MTDDEKGIRLEMEDDPQLLAEHREALAEKMKQDRTHASIMEYMTSHRLSRGEKQNDRPNTESKKSTEFIFLSPTLKKQWSEESRKRREQKEDNEPNNQEELDDVEGFLHIHTLPPERRKQILEQMKKKKE